MSQIPRERQCCGPCLPHPYGSSALSPPLASHSRRRGVRSYGEIAGLWIRTLSAVLLPPLIVSVTLGRGSQSGVILSLRECLALSGDIFSCHSCADIHGV